jgi:hypothetical protein
MFKNPGPHVEADGSAQQYMECSISNTHLVLPFKSLSLPAPKVPFKGQRSFSRVIPNLYSVGLRSIDHNLRANLLRPGLFIAVFHLRGPGIQTGKNDFSTFQLP